MSNSLDPDQIIKHKYTMFYESNVSKNQLELASTSNYRSSNDRVSTAKKLHGGHYLYQRLSLFFQRLNDPNFRNLW